MTSIEQDPIPAERGAIATSHYLATESGARVLRHGGNALDAAIAAAATLCVVYPNNVALGGDLVALVRSPLGDVHFVNATGRAPRGMNSDELRARHGSALPDRGIDTVTIPGGVRGWAALAELGASKGWTELLEDARRAAAEHPVSRSLANEVRKEERALRVDAGCEATFYPGGRALHEGDAFKQPALGATLAAISKHGPAEFYEGATARKWITGLQKLGSAITAEEVASYQPELAEPIRSDVFGHEVITSPPNTQGFSLLRTLEALERLHIQDPLGRDAATLARLFAEANLIRSRLLTDPDQGITARTLMDTEVEVSIHPDPATRVPKGDTVGLVVVDDDGWAVSLVQSVYWAFGACVLEPTTGVLFQNRGTSFSLDQGHVAEFEGGRRPPHSLMPVLVTKHGDLAFAQATMGGQAQPQIHAQLLLRLLAGASATEATSLPRWSIGAQEDGDTSATLRVETDVASTAQASLDASPFHRVTVQPRDEGLGHSNVIRVLGNRFDASSDPRSDGSGIVIHHDTLKKAQNS